MNDCESFYLSNDISPRERGVSSDMMYFYRLFIIFSLIGISSIVTVSAQEQQWYAWAKATSHSRIMDCEPSPLSSADLVELGNKLTDTIDDGVIVTSPNFPGESIHFFKTRESCAAYSEKQKHALDKYR
jgi:hypothetical protein